MPAAVQLCVHFTRAILFPSSRTSETPPQSGSGRKKQTKSKAAIRTARTPLRSACSTVFAGVDNVGSRGLPLARFLTAFSRKKAVLPKADAFVTPPQSGSSYQHRSSG